jgi:hypothetical protein
VALYFVYGLLFYTKTDSWSRRHAFTRKLGEWGIKKTFSKKERAVFESNAQSAAPQVGQQRPGASHGRTLAEKISRWVGEGKGSKKERAESESNAQSAAPQLVQQRPGASRGRWAGYFTAESPDPITPADAVSQQSLMIAQESCMEEQPVLSFEGEQREQRAQIDAPQTRQDDVLSALRDNPIFHFAGHGRTDSSDPSMEQIEVQHPQEGPFSQQSALDSEREHREQQYVGIAMKDDVLFTDSGYNSAPQQAVSTPSNGSNNEWKVSFVPPAWDPASQGFAQSLSHMTPGFDQPFIPNLDSADYLSVYSNAVANGQPDPALQLSGFSVNNDFSVIPNSFANPTSFTQWDDLTAIDLQETMASFNQLPFPTTVDIPAAPELSTYAPNMFTAPTAPLPIARGAVSRRSNGNTNAYTCSFTGCGKVFARLGDLARHRKQYDAMEQREVQHAQNGPILQQSAFDSEHEYGEQQYGGLAMKDDMPFTDSGYNSAPHLEHSLNVQPVLEGSPCPLIVCSSSPRGDGGDYDAKTLYSIGTTVNPGHARNYIIELAKDIYNKLHHSIDVKDVTVLPKILPELVKAFAIKLCHDDPTQENCRIMHFIHKRHQ